VYVLNHSLFWNKIIKKLSLYKLKYQRVQKMTTGKGCWILSCNCIFEGGLVKMAQQEGVTSLWNGTIPSLILVSNPAIQFMTYEAIKRRLHALCDKQHLSGLVYFFVGAVAKAVATVLTYPLQLVQTKLRVRDHHPSVSVHSGPIYESTFLEDTRHLLLHLVIRLRMDGAIPPLPQMPSWHAEGRIVCHLAVPNKNTFTTCSS